MSCLYIISCDKIGVIKIGVSNNVKRRLIGLQSGFPYALSLFHKWELDEEMAYDLESASHHILDVHRLNGEWFSCNSKEAVDAIEEYIAKSENGTNIIAYEDFVIAKVRHAATLARVRGGNSIRLRTGVRTDAAA